jgi:hypothetical protein
MGVSSIVRTPYTSGAAELIPDFHWGSFCSNLFKFFCVVICRPLFVFLFSSHLAAASSVLLRISAYNNPFGIFKLSYIFGEFF